MVFPDHTYYFLSINLNFVHAPYIYYIVLVAMVLHRLHEGAGSPESLLPERVINIKYFWRKQL